MGGALRLRRAACLLACAAASVVLAPPVAGGLVWTKAQTGHLYGLDPATGKIRQQAVIGTPANHFPTPGSGAGLMLVPSAQNVIAFRASSAGAKATSMVARDNPVTPRLHQRPAGSWSPASSSAASSPLAHSAGSSGSFAGSTGHRTR
jgi:hypothetical protein